MSFLSRVRLAKHGAMEHPYHSLNHVYTFAFRLHFSSLQLFRLPGSLSIFGQIYQERGRRTVSNSGFHSWPQFDRCAGLSTDTSDYSYYGDYNGEYQTEYGGYGQDQGYGEGYADPGYLPLVRSINSGSNIGRALQGALDTIVENI